jgi:tyrosine-protein kinase Etk/Wzc
MATETPLRELHEPADGPHFPEAADNGAKARDNHPLLDILVILADHWRVIFWTTVCFALLSISVSLLLPKRYTATVTLLPPKESSSLDAILDSELNGEGESPGMNGLAGMAATTDSSFGLKNPNDRYVGMLKSRTVEDAVIQQFGLVKEYHKRYVSDARKAFESRCEVDGNAKDGMIHISVEDHNPQRAAEIANGYLDAFKKLSEHLAVIEASQRSLFFDQQLVQAKDNLANSEEALKQTEQKTGLIQLDSQALALIESVASLRAQIAAQQMMIQGMETYATGQNARLVQAEQELNSLRGQLAKLGGSEKTDDGLIVPKGLVPEAGLEYVRRLRDVKYYQTIFEILARQDELARLDEAREGAVIQVVDPAIPPDKRSFPKRTYIVLGSTLGGLIIGILSAFLIAGYSRMKTDPFISSDKIRARSGGFI